MTHNDSVQRLQKPSTPQGMDANGTASRHATRKIKPNKRTALQTSLQRRGGKKKNNPHTQTETDDEPYHIII